MRTVTVGDFATEERVLIPETPGHSPFDGARNASPYAIDRRPRGNNAGSKPAISSTGLAPVSEAPRSAD